MVNIIFLISNLENALFQDRYNVLVLRFILIFSWVLLRAQAIGLLNYRLCKKVNKKPNRIQEET